MRAAASRNQFSVYLVRREKRRDREIEREERRREREESNVVSQLVCCIFEVGR